MARAFLHEFTFVTLIPTQSCHMIKLRYSISDWPIRSEVSKMAQLTKYSVLIGPSFLIQTT
jgi:hypothetical protein